MKRKKHYSQCYRYKVNDELFAQIKKGQSYDDYRGWCIEFREVSTGDLRCYLGVWPTLKKAEEELKDAIVAINNSGNNWKD